MDIQPQNQQPISDDQELAKVLAGVSQQADEGTSGLQFEETPPAIPVPPAPAMPDTPELPEVPEVALPSEPVTQPAPVSSDYSATTGSSELDDIKKDALAELRPLIDKLDVSPEEKFDTLLLIIRSTDDQSLLAATHEAAKAIPDDSRRAQALLDIIKEIDFFSNKA
jgi:hypothetical protein